MVQLSATTADYNELFEQMPLAAERLKVIILTRMLREREDGDSSDRPVSDSTRTAGEAEVKERTRAAKAQVRADKMGTHEPQVRRKNSLE
jgi:hypothetical protein